MSCWGLGDRRIRLANKSKDQSDWPGKGLLISQDKKDTVDLDKEAVKRESSANGKVRKLRASLVAQW